MAQLLSDPALTGMTRNQLQQIIQRLSRTKPPTVRKPAANDAATRG
jgi:hypothetical protein